MALNVYEEDELPFIRLISKLKCKQLTQHIYIAFEYEKLYDPQRQDLIKRSLSLLDNGEFLDLIIPCFGDTVDKFGILMPKSLKE